MKELKKDLLVLKALTDRIVANMGDTSTKTFNNDDKTLGEVSWCRLYESDEQALEAICKRENRKKSQMIRVIVNEYLRRN
jgi:hypothetical protein